MSTKRFAIPSGRLRHGWSHGQDFARIVEARLVPEKEYLAARLEVGCVYFIGEQLGGDTIKIGWSRDPVLRLQQIQTGNPTPLKIIGCVAAHRMIEPALHQLFALASVSGEWFTDPEGSIVRWLNEMTFGQPIERCRWYRGGAQTVTWEWVESDQLHRPLFSTPESA